MNTSDRLSAQELDSTRFDPGYERNPTSISHQAHIGKTSIDPVQTSVKEGKLMESKNLPGHSLNKKLNLLTYIMKVHDVPEHLYPVRYVFANKDIWEQDINLFIDKRRAINEFKRKKFNQEKVHSFTKSLSDISEAIELTKKALRTSGSTSDMDHAVERLKEVEKMIQILLMKKLNFELFSPQKAYFMIGPLDPDVSDRILNFLREGIMNELKELLTFQNFNNVHDLNVLHKTTFLILNNVRKHHLVNEASLRKVLTNPDTISLIAKLVLQPDSENGLKSYFSQLKSREVTWRDSLNELIREIPKKKYQTYYQIEKTRISTKLQEEQQIQERENEMNEDYLLKHLTDITRIDLS